MMEAEISARRPGVERCWWPLAIGGFLLLAPLSVDAQFISPAAEGGVPFGGPRVFLDCQGQIPCNRNHFRTEIQFVNWAQDREDSDVHVIATSESVGGGGRRYTLDFIGRGSMGHLMDQLIYTSSGSDVQAETLDGLTRALRLGLMRYAVESGLGPDFDIRFTGDLTGQAGGSGLNGDELSSRADPWNYWTFRIGLSGDMNIRETSKNTRINPSFSADRVTEEWKLGFEVDMDYRRNSRQLSDGDEVRDDRDEWDLQGMIVRSVNGHFSGGMAFRGRNSVSDNQDARMAFAPAVEYNYFPYVEANRRQFTVRYSAGVEHSNYVEETVSNLFVETRPLHELRVRYNAREQWGNAGIGADYSQYLHETGLYRLGLNGNLNFRITRGLDLNLNGNASLVEDQLHIPLADISDEDILLGRQNLPSTYQYNASIGLGYRWGSSFTNIVNTRLGGGGGSFF